MGGKGKGKPKKGSQPSRAQQQQQAAARRGAAAIGGSRSPAASAPRPAEPPAPQAVAPTAEVHQYVDVSAVSIQEWLGRTPDLKFRRGGSVLLSRATERSFWDARMPAGARWNDEAGEVDGVIPLIVGDGAVDAAPGKNARQAEKVAREVVEQLRAMLPHCPLQAIAGQGESYVAAYPAMKAARRNGALLVDSPPAPTELFLAKPCDQCRAAAATVPRVPVQSGEKPVDLCAECAGRLHEAGRTAGLPAQAPRPERRLREVLKETEMNVGDFSDTFAEMAAAGERERDDKATQLALIYADGNRVGAFLSRAAEVSGGPDKAKIASLLDRATLGALAQAVVNRFAGWARPPVIVNLAGGDDILVSVPAADAWLFTKTLIRSFTAILAAEVSGWPPAVREHVPTLAAGMVFHHASTPFSDVVRLASGQLRDAKAKTRGGAAISFLDMTADDSAAPAGRLPVTLRDLDKQAGSLSRIAALPASRRQSLLDLYRAGDTDGFIARLTDFADNGPLWEIASGPGAAPSAVRDELRGSEGSRDTVRRALDIARHWNAEPRQEPRRQEAYSR